MKGWFLALDCQVEGLEFVLGGLDFVFGVGCDNILHSMALGWDQNC